MNKYIKYVLWGIATIAILLGAVVVLLVVIAWKGFNALPDGTISVPFNKAVNKTEYLLASGHEQKAELRLKFLERKVKEAEEESNENDFDEVLDESEDFREEVEELQEDLSEIAETGKSTDALNQKLAALLDREIGVVNNAAGKSSGRTKEQLTKEAALVEALK